MIPGSMPLKAGNVYRAEVSDVAVVNGDSGKTIRVSGHALCEGNSVIETSRTMRIPSEFIARTVFFKHRRGTIC